VYVLEALAAVDSDTALFTYLTSGDGVGEDKARAMVDDLANYRPARE
jgi:hypothetical protein